MIPLWLLISVAATIISVIILILFRPELFPPFSIVARRVTTSTLGAFGAFVSIHRVPVIFEAVVKFSVQRFLGSSIIYYTNNRFILFKTIFIRLPSE
jgi:hypothetical protein